MNTEPQILNDANQRLNELAGIELAYEPYPIQEDQYAYEPHILRERQLAYGARALPKGKITDGLITVKKGNIEQNFTLHIKNNVSNEYALQLDENKKGRKKEPLIMAYYIAATAKATLRQKGINYIEATGNCYIDTKQVFIFINDQKATELRDRTEGRLWKPAGLKFVFALLMDDALLNKPYREIAQKAGIALGTVGMMIDELKLEGYIKEGKKENKTFYFLERYTALAEKWGTFYHAVLRPKYAMGRFKALNRNADQLLLGRDTMWGGEPAAEKLTRFLVPERYTIYTWKPKTELMRELRLVPDKEGNIELVQAFWNKELLQPQDGVAPAVLVYADLAAGIDSRNHEAAARIKKQYFGK